MDNREYFATQQFIMNVGRMVQQFDLTAFCDLIALKHTTAAQEDPTAYSVNAEAFEKMEQIANALREFKDKVQTIAQGGEGDNPERSIILKP